MERRELKNMAMSLPAMMSILLNTLNPKDNDMKKLLAAAALSLCFSLPAQAAELFGIEFGSPARSCNGHQKRRR